MFNLNPFKLPTYKEVKESTEKLYADSVKFFEEWVKDIEKYSFTLKNRQKSRNIFSQIPKLNYGTMFHGFSKFLSCLCSWFSL